MITISKKSCMSLHALMFGAALFISVSVKAMNEQNVNKTIINKAAWNELLEKFSYAFKACDQYAYRPNSTRYGKRYEHACNMLKNGLYQVHRLSPDEINNKINRAYYLAKLSDKEEYVNRSFATLSTDSELWARESLRNWEQEARKHGYEDLVVEEPLADKNRFDALKKMEDQISRSQSDASK